MLKGKGALFKKINVEYHETMIIINTVYRVLKKKSYPEFDSPQGLVGGTPYSANPQLRVEARPDFTGEIRNASSQLPYHTQNNV